MTDIDPIDPDASTFTDIVEGTTEDGTEVESVHGSELMEGGEE
jgi:hypothetical protein